MKTPLESCMDITVIGGGPYLYDSGRQRPDASSPIDSLDPFLPTNSPTSKPSITSQLSTKLLGEQAELSNPFVRTIYSSGNINDWSWNECPVDWYGIQITNITSE